MGNGFVDWFSRSYKGIIVALVAIMAIMLVVLAMQHVNASKPAAGAAPGPIPTFTSAPIAEVATIPKNADVLILGDSYTQGYGSSDQSKLGWAPLVATHEGWKATIDGIGNTGYTAGGQADGSGENTFGKRLAAHAAMHPDLVIIQGGQNDWRPSSTDLATAATETFAAVQKQWPDAKIVALGPSAPQPAGDKYAGQSKAIGAAARGENVPFISPVGARWMTAENSSKYAYTDGQHLNDAGHEYLASHVEQALTLYVKTAA
jgi:lysophospholipase L1-like esterase